MVVSDKLMVCVEGELEITTPSGEVIQTRSCLVKAGIEFDKKQIKANNATMSIYYLAPLTQDAPVLEYRMQRVIDGLYCEHPEEDALLSTLLYIRNNEVSPSEAYASLRPFIIPTDMGNAVLQEFDERIVKTVQRVRTTVIENLPIRQLAEEVCLSESRLEKLFKAHLGIPITKYRLRYRVFVGIIHMAMGESVTDAALAAGFASPAHFSKSFSSINGVPPAAAFLKPPFMEVLVANKVFDIAETPADVSYELLDNKKREPS